MLRKKWWQYSGVSLVVHSLQIAEWTLNTKWSVEYLQPRALNSHQTQLPKSSTTKILFIIGLDSKSNVKYQISKKVHFVSGFFHFSSYKYFIIWQTINFFLIFIVKNWSVLLKAHNWYKFQVCPLVDIFYFRQFYTWPGSDLQIQGSFWMDAVVCTP